MISYDIYLFHYYSFSLLINRCNFLNIEVKKYFVYGNDYYLKIPRRDRKKVQDNFKDYKIVSKLGVINFFELLISKPITLVSLVVSILLFFNLSSRVYDIEISGDYPYIESDIRNFLKKEKVYEFNYNISLEEMKDLEDKLQEEFNEEIEFIEITRKGSKVFVNYKKRRKVNINEENKGCIYATKDGVIKGFNLLSGVKNVNVNDFVRKGDLLVSDYIVNNKDENVNIVTRGSVYAETYYFIDITLSNDDNELNKYFDMLDRARYEISKNLNSDEEYIEKESIITYDLESGYMRVYYVLYEDITI